MRCDLHVHSWYSGAAEVPVLENVGRECYSDPREVYERALARGMDLVTLTDHDTIDGALRLMGEPRFFAGEEVTLGLGGGRKLHVNVFDVDEARHGALQQRRDDPEAFFAYLSEERLPASVNHLFSRLTGDRRTADLRLPLGRLPLVEARNGAMPGGHNDKAALVGGASGMAPVGGSDAHCLAHVARAYTVVPGARSKEDYLEGLRRGLTIARGRSGSYARLTSEVTRIFAAGYRETVREVASGRAETGRVLAAAALLPLVPLVPVFTLAVYLRELRFGAREFRALAREWGWASERLAPAGAAVGEAA
jgi:predicted metal-dependent phosphoesterase TrpH